MRAFSYACSLPVTWKRWQLHHSIHRTRKPHAASKHHGSMFDQIGAIADQSFTLREQEFSTFLAPVTLTLTQWPSYTNSTRRPWTSYIKAFGSYHLIDRHIYINTDTQTDVTITITHTALRVVIILKLWELCKFPFCIYSKSASFHVQPSVNLATLSTQTARC